MAEVGCIRDSYATTPDAEPNSCPGYKPAPGKKDANSNLVLVDAKTGKTKASAERANEMLGFKDINSDYLVLSNQAPLAVDITSRTTAPSGLNSGATNYYLALWDMETGRKRWEVATTTSTDPGGYEHTIFDTVAVTADRVLVRQSVDKNFKLRGYSTTDGSLQWTSAFNLTSVSPALKVSDNGKYIAVVSTDDTSTSSVSGFIAALDTSTGTVLARRDDNLAGHDSVVRWAGSTIILGESGSIEAFAADQGLRPVGSSVFGKASVNVLVNDSGSTVYVKDSRSPSTLKALDVATDTIKWSITLQRFFTMIAGRNGKLIGTASDAVGEGTGYQIVVLDGNTGVQLKVIDGDLRSATATYRNGHFLSDVSTQSSGIRLEAWQVLTGTPLGAASSKNAVPPLLILPA